MSRSNCPDQPHLGPNHTLAQELHLSSGLHTSISPKPQADQCLVLSSALPLGCTLSLCCSCVSGSVFYCSWMDPTTTPWLCPPYSGMVGLYHLSARVTLSSFHGHACVLLWCLAAMVPLQVLRCFPTIIFFTMSFLYAGIKNRIVGKLYCA